MTRREMKLHFFPRKKITRLRPANRKPSRESFADTTPSERPTKFDAKLRFCGVHDKTKPKTVFRPNRIRVTRVLTNRTVLEYLTRLHDVSFRRENRDFRTATNVTRRPVVGPVRLFENCRQNTDFSFDFTHAKRRQRGKIYDEKTIYIFGGQGEVGRDYIDPWWRDYQNHLAHCHVNMTTGAIVYLRPIFELTDW